MFLIFEQKIVELKKSIEDAGDDENAKKNCLIY